MKKLFIIAFAALFIASCGGNADNISVNQQAPGFTLEDSQGNSYSLQDFRNENVVVLYFYPKAGTPGCTDQACGIRDDYTKFEEKDIKIFGISVDEKDDLKDFRDEYNLNFPLLSDADKSVAEKYGVINNLGMANRITFIIDKSGNIAHIIRDVDVDTHAEDVYKKAVKLI